MKLLTVALFLGLLAGVPTEGIVGEASPEGSGGGSVTELTTTPASNESTAPTTTSPNVVASTPPSAETQTPTDPTTQASTITNTGDIYTVATTDVSAVNVSNGTQATPTTAVTTEEEEDEGVAPTYPPGEIEPSISISIFFIMLLLSGCVVVVHLMIKFRFHFLPESIAFVLIGFVIGFVYHYVIRKIGYDLVYQASFSPQSFFLLLLPPIIFESGYSLHKGNFFQNLGSIMLFAVLGTVISTLVVGGGLFALSTLEVIYHLNFIQSFAFGALISAVDPVATLAIFKALDVNPTLNMLVFGESVLNDAVSIVMTKTILEQSTSTASPGIVLLHSLGQFLLMFFVSALIGIAFALASALFLKFVKLREHYSIEFAMWFIFAFGPYFLAEGLRLSGIMAVLFCGIVMSHYTHFNLSPVTQVTVQQAIRTISFMAETVIFLYLGMQVFTISTSFKVELIIWSLILILLGRAANIYPLSFLVNRFRSVKINPSMQFTMWFSGLRGAVAYALALNLVDNKEAFGEGDVVKVLDTTTLVIVLFTILVFGGSTLPLLKCLNKGAGSGELSLSKTEEQDVAVATTTVPEPPKHNRHQWFLTLDYKYIKPLLIRRFTKAEVKDAQIEMQRRTNEWYQGLRSVSSDEENNTAAIAPHSPPSTASSSSSHHHSSEDGLRSRENSRDGRTSPLPV